MVKKWFLFLGSKDGVSSDEFLKEWERGDLESELFQVSGLRFLKLVEEKLKRGDSVPPIFVLTMFVPDEDTSLPLPVRELIMKRCNVFGVVRKNWKWFRTYDAAEYITYSFLRHTANYYMGLKKSYPPFKCLLTEKAEEADYLLIPFGKKDKEVDKMIVKAYYDKYGDVKTVVERLNISEWTVKNKLGIRRGKG